MTTVNLWLDDVRPAPEGWLWVKTAQEAKEVFENTVLATEGTCFRI